MCNARKENTSGQKPDWSVEYAAELLQIFNYHEEKISQILGWKFGTKNFRQKKTQQTEHIFLKYLLTRLVRFLMFQKFRNQNLPAIPHQQLIFLVNWKWQ